MAIKNTNAKARQQSKAMFAKLRYKLKGSVDTLLDYMQELDEELAQLDAVSVARRYVGMDGMSQPHTVIEFTTPGPEYESGEFRIHAKKAMRVREQVRSELDRVDENEYRAKVKLLAQQHGYRIAARWR